MRVNLLKLLVLTLVLAATNAFGRAPAVENFFELTHETMNKQRVPSDVKTGFEFKKVQRTQSYVQKTKQPSTGFAISTLIGLFALFALPFGTHLVISSVNKNKYQSQNVSTADIISKYKKVDQSKSDDDDFSQAA